MSQSKTKPGIDSIEKDHSEFLEELRQLKFDYDAVKGLYERLHITEEDKGVLSDPKASVIFFSRAQNIEIWEEEE